jgi:hypothetical protein
MAVLWDVTSCSVLEVYRRFRGVCYLVVKAVIALVALVNFYQTIQRNIAEKGHLLTLRSEISAMKKQVWWLISQQYYWFKVTSNSHYVPVFLELTKWSSSAQGTSVPGSTSASGPNHWTEIFSWNDLWEGVWRYEARIMILRSQFKKDTRNTTRSKCPSLRRSRKFVNPNCHTP